MTPSERKSFAMEVATVLHSMQNKEQDFWIDGEKHYQDHIKFCGWVTFFEKCKEELGSAARKLCYVGVMAAFATGIYFAINN